MMPPRQLPLPGSPEARNQGCTCPMPPSPMPLGSELPTDRDCPVHGLAATARGRAAERGAIDTEGDIVDRASEPALRRG